MNEPSTGVLWSLLMVLFAVLFSSRPVVYLNVSMTFTPMALPIGFNTSVNAYLCFEISSLTTAAQSGNRQPGSPPSPHPTQCCGHSLLASVGDREGGLRVCVCKEYEVLVLEIPLLEVTIFDIRFCLIGTVPEKGSLILNPYYEGIYLTLVGQRGFGSLPQGRRIEFLKENSEKKHPCLHFPLLCPCVWSSWEVPFLFLSDLHLLSFPARCIFLGRLD